MRGQRWIYLPEDWAADPIRRGKAGVPDDVGFATKPEIALKQIRAAVEAGIPQGMVLMDAGYGADTKLRTGVSALGLCYVAGIQPNTTVWAPGTQPLPPKEWSGRGRPTSRMRRDAEHRPLQVKALALGLPEAAWEMITWREASADWLTSRFARLRVRAAHRDYNRSEPYPENGCSSNGPRARRSRPSIGSPPCLRPLPSPSWSIVPSCAGASSATIRNSNRNLASDITRDVAGAASTITPRSRLPLTDS